MTDITRRRLLGLAGTAGLAFAAPMAGCADGSENSESTKGASGDDDATDGRFSLIPVFDSGEKYLAAGTSQRLPFVIAGSDGAPLETINRSVSFTVSKNGKQVGDAIEVPGRTSGTSRAYLALPFTAPEPGIYDIVATYDGRELDAAVQFWARDEVDYPQIGDPIPSVVSPTATAPGTVDPICTADPPCPLHALEFATQLGARRPIALLVSTPAYCQTAICGPVLDFTVTAAGKTPGVDFLHAEVYANPTKVDSIASATQSPVVEAFAMPFEPAMFIVDEAGILVARLDSVFDAGELDDALKLIS